MIDIKWDGLTEVIVPSKCTCEEILMDDKFDELVHSPIELQNWNLEVGWEYLLKSKLPNKRLWAS